VLLTSHYLEEIEALAERVVVVGGGRVLADDTVAAVRGLVDVRRVSLVADALPDLPGVVHIEQSDGRVDITTVDADQLVRALVRSGAEFRDLEVRSTSLEEAFLLITEPAPASGRAHATQGSPS
jgi:ABC-2 type transport system ATP-binding protein